MSADGPPATGQVPEIQAPSLVGEVLDGRYRIKSKLGEGGMGEVYAAEHVHIEKRLAIKLLRPEIVSNPEAVTRFRQEARSSSSIGHRNIIAIEDFGQLADGRIYMCMELLNGAALNDMITQPMAIDRLLNILIQTGHGLAAAHAKGIVHRDMKPENIFVTIGASGEDIPKILDFGIAKVAGNDGQNHLTRTGTIFGTPFYMAPEQALGNPVDARTDIYAVGVIMYECFSGSLPFQGDSFMGILTQHITMEPEPVAQRAAKAGRHMPPGLAEIITRCMQKNPAQRFTVMDELVNALIQIYRGIVGPGMSTYMEAFPVAPSPGHSFQPTPPPMTGPVPMPVSASYGSAPVIPAQLPGPPSAAYSDASSASSVIAPVKKGRTGLILAILAILMVGGGVSALVIVNSHKPGRGPGPGSGTGGSNGSQVAINDPHRGSNRPIPPDARVMAPVPPDSAVSPPPRDAAVVALVPDAGQIVTAPVDAGNTVPAVEVVRVLLLARNGVDFEVYEYGSKILSGPDELGIPKGERRSVVIKARGFRDKMLVIDTSKKRVQFLLERIPSSSNPGFNSGTNSALGHLTPQGANCAGSIVEPRSKACVAQYCAKHPEDVSKCGLE
ncbi:MAG TPA: serine/threonine-protein kinase [Kofleriaceae bacterium]|jgi:serine/threonine-protein kinase|nr:serine/threonine-protein kinase [Kofleriaceae bacterium]